MNTNDKLCDSSAVAGSLVQCLKAPRERSLHTGKITWEAIGVSVSPHMFRTAGGSTAAIYGGGTPYLASALLDHRDPRVTEEHYNRASSMSAAQVYASLIDALRGCK